MKLNFKIPAYLRNRYAITAFVFIVWVAFFDQNNLMTKFQYWMDLKALEDEKAFYQEEIIQTKEDLNELQSNLKSLEKFAREKYLMKRDNEEIFVIVEKE